jgi:hypothetical protein
VALICFFRSSSALINRAFSGVIRGVFGAEIVGDINGLLAVLELVEGLPPLVCGRAGVCDVPSECGTGGGESVMLGGSV